MSFNDEDLIDADTDLTSSEPRRSNLSDISNRNQANEIKGTYIII
jgi:hypothetical protein